MALERNEERGKSAYTQTDGVNLSPNFAVKGGVEVGAWLHGTEEFQKDGVSMSECNREDRGSYI